MDPDILQGVAAVLGIMVPLLAIGIGGLLVLSRSRIGEAIARRIAGETNERLDFAERLLIARPHDDRQT
jgi:hypothetical protein